VLRAPTGRVVIVTPEPHRAAALLGGAVEERDGERLVVRAGDPGDLNARLVGSGVVVRELGPERRSLEDVIDEHTSRRSQDEVAR